MMTDASVLVVEDNPMSRATAVDMFIDLGFAVFDAYNGYHALALLERHPEISLLFVDVRMPGMSGPELAELVRQDVPISRSFSPQATLARNPWQATFTSCPSLGGWTRLPKRLADVRPKGAMGPRNRARSSQVSLGMRR